jgi:hypothetical protein
MQKQTIKQLGKQMREKLPLLEDLPLPILRALERLANADQRCAAPSSGATGET